MFLEFTKIVEYHSVRIGVNQWGFRSVFGILVCQIDCVRTHFAVVLEVEKFFPTFVFGLRCIKSLS